jgi:hypothetical protein
MGDIGQPGPLCPVRLGCGWSSAKRKHFPFKGLRPEHTAHQPARYLPGTTEAQIRMIETATATAPDRKLAAHPHAKYARAVGAPIGWDNGADAVVSFVECSGGLADGRAYHGRPMAGTNPKLK